MPIFSSKDKNANAIVRKNITEVELNSLTNVYYKKYTLITVFNPEGDDVISNYAYYDGDSKIKNLDLKIYNSLGVKIHDYNIKDFQDVSSVSGSTLYSDARVKYFNYRPTSYPYTVAFLKEIKFDDTSLIPGHNFISNYDTYIKESTYKLYYNKEEWNLLFNEKNFDSYNIDKKEVEGGIVYELKDSPSIPNEELSLPYNLIFPKLEVTSSDFTIAGHKAENISNWNSLGKWFSSELLDGRTELSLETETHIKKITSHAQDPIEKAKIIYKYVQDNTRYISVQVGIGGLQPIIASEVDNVKYGDCKGLSNYTKALLSLVGVDAYYVHVEAGTNKVDFEDNFATLAQGNHAILCIPDEKNLHWIDCTSSTLPFGFLGTFTDDRKAFVMKPDGGQIVKTPQYLNEDNLQLTQAEISFSPKGKIKVLGSMKTYGSQYDSRSSLEHYSLEDLKKRDYKFWSTIHNLNIIKHDMLNNKDEISFVENFEFEGDRYTEISGDRCFVKINVINPDTYVPSRYRNRKTDFYYPRGYQDKDEIKIKIPENYIVEAIPYPVNLKTEFGSYKMEVIKENDHLLYKKTILIKEGKYTKEKYKAFRAFRKSIANAEAQKISFIKQN
ncbi:DUF3857 domain-containing protein [Mesonia phycicola]|nr:DUF3857 domain-containing protein [Mesonia phycicola]